MGMRSVERGLEIPQGAPDLPQHGADRSPQRQLNCPVCGQLSVFVHPSKDADLYRCPDCDHCFSDPATLRGVEDYGPEYYEKDWFQNDNTKLFETIARVIATENQSRSVIDVGCGNGAFLKYLRRRLPNLSLLCAPNGTVVIMTMNDRSLLYGTARLLARLGFSMAADQLYSRHHVNHFNLESLQRLICSSGLVPVRRILHNIPIAAVDITSGSPLVKGILRAGVWGIFTMSRVTGSTYLQTVLCRKQNGA